MLRKHTPGRESATYTVLQKVCVASHVACVAELAEAAGISGKLTHEDLDVWWSSLRSALLATQQGIAEPSCSTGVTGGTPGAQLRQSLQVRVHARTAVVQ